MNTEQRFWITNPESALDGKRTYFALHFDGNDMSKQGWVELIASDTEVTYKDGIISIADEAIQRSLKNYLEAVNTRYELAQKEADRLKSLLGTAA